MMGVRIPVLSNAWLNGSLSVMDRSTSQGMSRQATRAGRLNSQDRATSRFFLTKKAQASGIHPRLCRYDHMI